MNRPAALLLGLLAAPAALHVASAQPETRPVRTIAPNRIDVIYPSGVARFPLYTSADLTTPQPAVTRAVLVFHGLQRNADVYYADALKARAAAGPDAANTLMIAPQFLADIDVAGHDLPADTLAWKRDRWAGGDPALSPAPLSGFDAVDAILTRLADRALFPNLAAVIVAGHSAGGQIVQRYAVVGRGEAALTKAGVTVRYVVANPSSYLYFTPDRPFPVTAASCPTWNNWRYGFSADVPPYVQGTPADLEQRYAARHVAYLLGTADIDPNHRVLDKSCAGEAEGAYRYARGHAYYAMMLARHPTALNQTLHDVPGVGHDGEKMFTSACGLAALFDRPGCP